MYVGARCVRNLHIPSTYYSRCPSRPTSLARWTAAQYHRAYNRTQDGTDVVLRVGGGCARPRGSVTAYTPPLSFYPLPSVLSCVLATATYRFAGVEPRPAKLNRLYSWHRTSTIGRISGRSMNAFQARGSIRGYERTCQKVSG